MKNLLTLIAKELVDDPEQVKVNEIDGGHTTVLELTVAKQDMGKIIGAKGRNITAIRTVVNGASKKIKRRTVIELLE